MKRAGLSTIAAGFGPAGALALETVTLPFDNGGRPLVKYPQKRLMIGVTSRPPQLETPFTIFNDGAITPNGGPLNIDPDKSRSTSRARSIGRSHSRSRTSES